MCMNGKLLSNIAELRGPDLCAEVVIFYCESSDDSTHRAFRTALSLSQFENYRMHIIVQLPNFENNEYFFKVIMVGCGIATNNIAPDRVS